MKDIESIEDIQLMVNTFYDNIRKDESLGPIFDERIQDRWPIHLKKMYSFWETILLENERTYFGQPFPPHANMPIGKEHFDRWLHIFKETINCLFKGVKADEAMWRAQKMAEIFHYKIDYIQQNSNENIV